MTPTSQGFSIWLMAEVETIRAANISPCLYQHLKDSKSCSDAISKPGFILEKGKLRPGGRGFEACSVQWQERDSQPWLWVKGIALLGGCEPTVLPMLSVTGRRSSDPPTLSF